MEAGRHACVRVCAGAHLLAVEVLVLGDGGGGARRQSRVLGASPLHVRVLVDVAVVAPVFVFWVMVVLDGDPRT